MSDHLPPSKALLKKIAELVAAKDLDALNQLRGEYVVKQEASRTRFSRNRSPKNGALYRKVGVELGEIKTAIRGLDLSEEIIQEALGDVVRDGIRNVADRVRYGFGDNKARGRLDLNAAAKHMYKDWMAYVGRHSAAGDNSIEDAPNLVQLAEFLHFQYGLEISEEQLAKIAGTAGDVKPKKTADDHARDTLSHLKSTSPDEYNALRKKFQKKTESLHEADASAITFDPKVLFPKLANVLIQHGIISVSRKGGITSGSVAKQVKRADGGSVEQAPKKDPTKPAKEEPKAEPEQPEVAGEPTKDTNGDGKVDDQDMVAGSITNDGHFIDAKKFLRGLEETGVASKKDLDELRNVMSLNDMSFANRIRRSAERNGELARDVGGVVTAALGAISTTDSGQVKNNNVTASGNTVNITKFREGLDADGISGDMLNNLRAALKDSDINKVIQARGPNAKTAFAVAKSVVNAIQKVVPTKKGA